MENEWKFTFVIIQDEVRPANGSESTRIAERLIYHHMPDIKSVLALFEQLAVKPFDKKEGRDIGTAKVLLFKGDDLLLTVINVDGPQNERATARAGLFAEFSSANSEREFMHETGLPMTELPPMGKLGNYFRIADLVDTQYQFTPEFRAMLSPENANVTPFRAAISEDYVTPLESRGKTTMLLHEVNKIYHYHSFDKALAHIISIPLNYFDNNLFLPDPHIVAAAVFNDDGRRLFSVAKLVEPGGLTHALGYQFSEPVLQGAMPHTIDPSAIMSRLTAYQPGEVIALIAHYSKEKFVFDPTPFYTDFMNDNFHLLRSSDHKLPGYTIRLDSESYDPPAMVHKGVRCETLDEAVNILYVRNWATMMSDLREERAHDDRLIKAGIYDSLNGEEYLSVSFQKELANGFPRGAYLTINGNKVSPAEVSTILAALKGPVLVRADTKKMLFSFSQQMQQNKFPGRSIRPDRPKGMKRR